MGRVLKGLWLGALSAQAVVVATIGIACSGGGTESAGAGGTSSGGMAGSTNLTLEAYQNAFLDSYCEQLFNCPIPNDDSLGARAVLKTAERCRTHYTAILARSRGSSELSYAMGAGLIVFDAEMATACVAQQPSCSLEDDNPCQQMLKGTAALGADCYRQEECAGAAYCSGELAQCPGVCTAKKPPGSTCQSDFECDQSTGRAECNFSLDVPACVVRPLQHGATLDQACGVLPSGERMLCAAQYWCDGPYDGPGTCRLPLAVGQACDDGDLPCAGLAFCIGDGNTDTCQEVTIVSEAGGACDPVSPTATTFCDPVADLICVAGVCELAGDGFENSRCVPGDLGDASCQIGFYCAWETDTCLPYLPTGAPCSDSQSCAVSCDFASNTCVDRYCGL